VSEPHPCHFCGEPVIDGHETIRPGEPEQRRHWLSDCRPDLVKHEVGPDCTWAYLLDPGWIPSLRRAGKDHLADADEGRKSCYAYQDGVNGPWTDEHIHFYEDGPC
jgi:hypothetical protein